MTEELKKWKKSFYVYIISLALVNIFASSIYPYKIIFYESIGIPPSLIGTFLTLASFLVLPLATVLK